MRAAAPGRLSGSRSGRRSPGGSGDDFALGKGDSYATLLVDLEARRPLDLLPGRDAGLLGSWLVGHPEIEVICRDRAGAYADGARTMTRARPRRPTTASPSPGTCRLAPSSWNSSDRCRRKPGYGLRRVGIRREAKDTKA
ncbi:hypothetical protein ACIQB5_48925 [Streptomyces sp. NPDC088560]|uniref:hypothetical protein n=1 Tax=Streptomyces sp. NPDC088560 TaxID=3365868 RepID=UPI00380FF2B0